MDHGGEAARPTTAAASTEMGMPGAVRVSEANIGIGAFDGQLGADAAAPGSFSHFDLSAAAGRGVVPSVLVGPQSHLHRQPGPGGVAYPTNIGAASWRHPGPVIAVLAGPQLPGGVVPVHGNYGCYSALLPRPGPGARRGVVLGDLLPGGVDPSYDNYGYYALQPRPGPGYGEVLVDQLPDGAAHGEAFVGLLPGSVDAAYDNYGHYALRPRPGAGHSEVLFDLLPDGAGQGEVFVGLLPGGVDVGYDNYAWHPRPGAGRGEVLPDDGGVVFDGSGNNARQTLLAPGNRGADGITGALRGPNLVQGFDNRGVVGEHLRRLLPFAGIGASSMAINGLAAGPGSPAVAFELFVLLLGGLFLVTLHVLRV